MGPGIYLPLPEVDNVRMNLGLRQLENFLNLHLDADALVLATVTSIKGSSYRKPGAMMLVNSELEFAGLISGGCLEGDLVEHARAVFKDGTPRTITYDLSDTEDALFGLGLGCGGVVKLMLQKISKSDGFGILPATFKAVSERKVCIFAMALRERQGIEAAATALSIEGRIEGDAALCPFLEGQLESWEPSVRYNHVGPDNSVLLVRVEPPPRVLICGAGPDSVPVAKQVDLLGWEGIVVDHRSAYARTDRFPPNSRVICLEPGNLHKQVDLDLLDAAVVMSHNLVHDKTYLAQLSGKALPYLGLLGPRVRRETLTKELGISGGEIHGPAGLDIGAELPESIALSILAEIHLVLSSKTRSDA